MMMMMMMMMERQRRRYRLFCDDFVVRKTLAVRCVASRYGILK